MMNKRIILGFVILLLASPAYAQTVTIEQLITAALENHPYTSKIQSESQLKDLKAAGIRTALLPDISLNAQAGYQSLVPELPIQLPGMAAPNIPKDRYQASIDINQMIYDGGVTNERHRLLEIESELSQTRMLAERFPIQQQVVDAWYGLELLSMQRSALMLTLEDLEARLRTLQVGLDGGIVMQMDVDRVAVELERVKQKNAQIQSDSVRILGVLSEITGMAFTPQTTFAITSDDGLDIPQAQMRPELKLFDLSGRMADANVQLNRAGRRPKVSGYMQGAYGKPGLDIFADTFSPFWQAGVRSSWVLWDKGGSKRDAEVNRIVKKQIDDDRALFNRGMLISIQQQEAEIVKNRDLLQGDVAIIELHQRIKAASEAKLDEGIINATDYLADVRAVEQARIQYESRKIAIRYAKTQIQIIRGGL
jgi:outer membrane protein TolC